MNAIITANWDAYLGKFKEHQKDIYYYEGYVKLYETSIAKALCVICYDGDSILLMPFLRREIGLYYDFETPYGYGGPITNVEEKDWVEEALKAMRRCFIDEKYVCGFIRFHCLLSNADFCKNQIQTFFDRNTVMIETCMPEEEIWAHQITSKNRNMIRKAEKNNLVYKAEYDFASINEFVKLYNATMQRLNAEEFYYFDEQYYSRFVENLRGHAFLGTVRKDDKLICGALFMFSAKYGHYHLEGSNREYAGLAANNYLLWKTALEFHRLGVNQFHLGGGNDSMPDNSLLKFKKAFSNKTEDFYIGKWIFNDSVYQEIKEKWKKQNPEKNEKYGKLLLCYRC